MQRYPNVDVELRLGDEYIDLVAEGIDIAIRGGNLHDSSLRARRVGTSDRICVASSAYLKQRGLPLQPHDLTRHECIIYTLLASGSGSWPFKGGDVQVKGRVRLNSLDGIRRAILQDLGIGYLPAWMVARELHAGQLEALLAEHAAPGTPVNILYSAERLLPQRAAVFIEFIAEVLDQITSLRH